MKYTYNDIKDKSREGLRNELQEGLNKICVYFKMTLGIPVEIFNDWLQTKTPTQADQWLFYLNFRNKYPNVFKEYENTRH